MSEILSTPYLLPALLLLPFLATPYLASKPPTRSQLIKPSEEYVLILGGSEGCGKGLAEEYALKRGARVFLVARTESKLQALQNELIDQLVSIHGFSRSEAQSRVLYRAADISSSQDLIEVREEVIEAWGKLDTLHIISGLPATQTIYQSTGVSMVPVSDSSISTSSNSTSRTHRFVPTSSGSADFTSPGEVEDERALPSLRGLGEMEEEAVRLSAVNMSGVILSVGCFLPLLSSTSRSPLIHHLSSVAALVPAPTRMLYSATKTAGLAAFKTCAVECARDGGAGSGVRFLAICPGTIDTGFRRKSTSAIKAGGLEDELEGISSKVGQVLTVQDTVDSIIHHSSLTPQSSPLTFKLPIPILGDLLRIGIPFIKIPPTNIVVLPAWPYKLGWWVDGTWMRGFIEKLGRRKYGLV